MKMISEHHHHHGFISPTAAQETAKQVAQLSLTNPCVALHHDKRQNCKTVT